MRKLGLLCTLLLGAGLVMAQSNEAVLGTVQSAGGIQASQGDDAISIPTFAGSERAGGDTCAADAICGQVVGAGLQNCRSE